MAFEDRWYQTECVEAWYKDIQNPEVHPLVAVPTAGGKTVILGKLIETYLKDHPHDQVLVLSHTQEIIEQDHEALQEFFPRQHIGIYSSGLGQKEIEPITVGGIQSVYRQIEKFKWYNLIIVDEVHSVNHKNTGMYRTFFDGMMGATIAGMSATIYRTGHGYIHEGKTALFNKLSYDLTSTVNFNRLVKEGYLCNLISVAPKTQLNSDNVKKSAGDYNIKDLAKTHDKDEITKAAIKDALYYGKNYKKWLVFAIDIDHCNHIAKYLNQSGIRAMVLHSRMDLDRKKVINNFKAGNFQALVSVGMVTTGFNVPDVDLILLLRPTMSAVLHVQMVGRGLRVHPNKKHTLVLDYAGNTARLGPINNVIIPKKKGEKGSGEAPTKTCPVCNTITYTMAKYCDSCGHEFVFESKLTTIASDQDVIDRGSLQDDNPKIKWLPVKHVRYSIHTKIGAPDSLKVTYICGLQRIDEYVCIDHPNYAGYKAKHWLKYRGYTGPETVHGAFAHTDKIKKPSHIQVDFTGKYPNITNARFDTNGHSTTGT